MQQDTQSDTISIPEIISFIKQKDYKFIKKLGNGSFGITILVKDETIDEIFVCKKYQPLIGIDKENTKIIRCFVEGSYKYWKHKYFQVSTLNLFLKFLKTCTKEKKNIVLNNIHSRLDCIDRINNELINEEEIPF